MEPLYKNYQDDLEITTYLYSQSLISFYDSFVTNWVVDDLTFTNVLMFTEDGETASSSPKLISPDGSMIENSYEDSFNYIHYKKVAAKGASFSNLKFESVVCYGCVDSLIYFSAETLSIDSFTITSIKGYDADGTGYLTVTSADDTTEI